MIAGMLRYESRAASGPTQIDSSASLLGSESVSAFEWAMTVRMPSSRQVRMIRSAISPRLAIRILWNMNRARAPGLSSARAPPQSHVPDDQSGSASCVHPPKGPGARPQFESTLTAEEAAPLRFDLDQAQPVHAERRVVEGVARGQPDQQRAHRLRAAAVEEVAHDPERQVVARPRARGIRVGDEGLDPRQRDAPWH